MSLDIWTLCAGKSEIHARPETLVWRVTEDQSRSSSLKLVDSYSEHEILEDIIERGKPRFPYPDYEKQLHYLLWTPFRYPPLRNGSRFGQRNEISIWYGALTVESALAEKAYYQFVFRSGMTTDMPIPIENHYSAFSVLIKAREFVDLTAISFKDHQAIISSKTEYAASQMLGRKMREADVEAFAYRSARDPGEGINIGLFHPKAFASKKPIVENVWSCLETGEQSFFFRKDRGHEIKFSFERSMFLVNGNLPQPAL